MSIWAFQHFITGLLMLCVVHRHRAPIPLPSVWQCTFYLTVKKCFRDSTRSTSVFKCITAVRTCQYRLVPVDALVYDDPRTLDLCSLWCCKVAACHMHAVIQVLFSFCVDGEAHISVNVTFPKGKKCISNYVCNLFLYFCFCKWSLNICIRNDKSRKMYISSSYVQILCLVSYMAKLFFQKNNMNICKLRQK